MVFVNSDDCCGKPSLTIRGYDLLDLLGDKLSWIKAKNYFQKKGLPITYDLLLYYRQKQLLGEL